MFERTKNVGIRFGIDLGLEGNRFSSLLFSSDSLVYETHLEIHEIHEIRWEVLGSKGFVDPLWNFLGILEIRKLVHNLKKKRRESRFLEILFFSKSNSDFGSFEC